MRFTSGQLTMFSDLFADLAKGLFLASVASPTISPRLEFISSLQFAILGMMFIYLSLQSIKLKEEI